MNAAARPLPLLDDINRFFWTGGKDGVLRILRCGACGHWQHPPFPRCSKCRGEDLAPVSVAGRGTVATFTVNHQAWMSGLKLPYIIAIVELEEQVGLRLTTNLQGIEPDAVHIGMPVKVTFQQCDDVWLPLFTPA